MDRSQTLDSAERRRNTVTQLLTTFLLIAMAVVGYVIHTSMVARASRVIVVPRYDWSKSDLTLVVAVRYGCPYCEKSAPFYKRLLANTQRISPRKVRVLFISNDREEVANLALPPSAERNSMYSSVPFPDWVTGTPTIISVDRTGRVQKVWAGLLDSRKEGEVLDAVNLASGGSFR